MGRVFLRFGLSLAVLCSTLAGSAAAQDPRPHEPIREVLNVVVDSLPDVLDRIWGRRDLRPRTVVLARARLVAADLGIRAVRHGLLDEVEHASDWLGSQEQKDVVAGLCDRGSILDCPRGGATMVVALSQPAFDGSGAATVQLAMRRRADPLTESDRRSFFAQLRLALRQVDGHWEVVDLELLGIT